MRNETLSSYDAFENALVASRVIAIVRGTYSVDEYVDIAAALSSGGIPTFEFTMEQPHALEAIRHLRATSTGADIWVGAGTVRDTDDAMSALEAGAQFLVSPAFDPEVARLAQQQEIPYLPGALTPTEIEVAVAAGCRLVKLFPAQPLGPEYLKALAAPLTGVGFVPTGGVDIANAHEFLAAGAIAVGVGGSLVGRNDSPETLVRRAADLVHSLSAQRADG
jgi:2-dehydro-3-deoxyphosphogluconate aldolase/(4S)-4-hydroxy-2-oxoglutarate aldolase